MATSDYPIIKVKEIIYPQVTDEDATSYALRIGTYIVDSDESKTPTNTFVGYGAGKAHNNTSTGNTFVGSKAGYNTLSDTPVDLGNTFVGAGAGQGNTTGVYNSYYGFNSGLNCKTGGANVIIGSNAAANADAINSNTYIGTNVGLNVTTGDNNVIIGSNALSGAVTPSLTLDGVTVLGSNITTNPVGGSFMGSIAIGAYTVISASNTAYIGGGSTTLAPVTDVYFGGGDATLHAAAYNTPSDARLKSNVEGLTHGLSFIEKLRPVTYTMKDKKRVGLIAQEVEQVVKDVDFVNFDGVISPKKETDFYSLNYASLVPSLIKAVQELEALITANS